MWVGSSRLRVRLCDSESDVEGGDSALRLAVSFSQKCATMRQANVSCLFAVQRRFHGKKKGSDGGSQTTAGRPNAPWRLAEPQLVELLPTYVRRRMQAPGQVKTRARQYAVLQENESESKGIQGMSEQDEFFTDEMRGTWQDEAAAHRIFAMWAFLNRCVR